MTIYGFITQYSLIFCQQYNKGLIFYIYDIGVKILSNRDKGVIEPNRVDPGEE